MTPAPDTTGPQASRDSAHVERGRVPLILVATTVRGDPRTAQVTSAYQQATIALCRNDSLDFQVLTSLVQNDIVRARSALVRDFLTVTKATHLLFWDEDVVAEPRVIAALLSDLLATGHDYIGCSYPTKKIHWDRVCDWFVGHNTRPTPAQLKAAAYNQCVIADGTADATGRVPVEVVDRCAKVSRLGLGFTLLSRACLETMCDEYAPALSFSDKDLAGKVRETVALFLPMLLSGDLLSEDYSLCERWRACGGKIHLWCGPGELLHIGPYAYGSLG